MNQTDVATGDWKKIFDVFGEFSTFPCIWLKCKADPRQLAVQDDCDAFVNRVTNLWRKRRPDDFLQQTSVLGSNSRKTNTVQHQILKGAKVTKPAVSVPLKQATSKSMPRGQSTCSRFTHFGRKLILDETWLRPKFVPRVDPQRPPQTMSTTTLLSLYRPFVS